MASHRPGNGNNKGDWDVGLIVFVLAFLGVLSGVILYALGFIDVFW